MDFSNNPLHDLEKAGTKGDFGFSMIVAFNYYDGPESGIAVFPSGAGVRFESLGESRSRLFRAFELAALEGNWVHEAQALNQGAFRKPTGRVLLSSRGDERDQRFEARVRAAAVAEYFVGVGSANLDWLSISNVEAGQLKGLRTLSGPLAAFNAVRRLMKRG